MSKAPEVVATREWPESAWTLIGNPLWIVPETDERFEIEKCGPWGVVSKVVGLAVAPYREGAPRPYDSLQSPYYDRLRIFGRRTLVNARESGYDMEGQVTIHGRRYRAFTSSELFRKADGRLVNVATLYVVRRAPALV